MAGLDSRVKHLHFTVQPEPMKAGTKMRLWTMQSPDVDLSDIHYTVDHSKSQYVSTFPKYSELCRLLSEQLELGTEQYIWCLTQDEKTWNGCKKWVLDVPEKCVHTICSITWHWILARSNNDSNKCKIPDEFYRMCKNLNHVLNKNIFKTNSFNKQFHNGWRDKKDDELWDMLIVNETKNACTHALVLLPVNDWIKNEHKGR